MENKLSPELTNKILTTLKECKGDYEKTSKRMVMTERAIIEVDVVENKKFNYTPEGKGPKRMQRYLIASRHIFDPKGWDNSDIKISQARKLYDEGKIEMMTGRDGLIINLYAIPRRTQVRRKPYFSTQADVQLIG